MAQISTATGRLTEATSIRARPANRPGARLPSTIPAAAPAAPAPAEHVLKLTQGKIDTAEADLAAADDEG